MSATIQREVAKAASVVPVLQPRRVLGALALYFFLHATWRVLLTNSLELDESAQVLLAQTWSWGYGLEQPPLYTWLLRLFFNLFGLNMAALVFFKALLLLSTYYFVFC